MELNRQIVFILALYDVVKQIIQYSVDVLCLFVCHFGHNYVPVNLGLLILYYVIVPDRCNWSQVSLKYVIYYN